MPGAGDECPFMTDSTDGDCSYGGGLDPLFFNSGSEPFVYRAFTYQCMWQVMDYLCSPESRHHLVKEAALEPLCCVLPSGRGFPILMSAAQSALKIQSDQRETPSPRLEEQKQKYGWEISRMTRVSRSSPRDHGLGSSFSSPVFLALVRKVYESRLRKDDTFVHIQIRKIDS